MAKPKTLCHHGVLGSSSCLQCRQENNRRWEQRHPERAKQVRSKIMRRSNLKKNFGISPEQWADIFASQSARCAVCNTATANSKIGWCTDHDHKTKKVRGILCYPCNVVLGYCEKYGCPMGEPFKLYIKYPPADKILVAQRQEESCR